MHNNESKEHNTIPLIPLTNTTSSKINSQKLESDSQFTIVHDDCDITMANSNLNIASSQSMERKTSEKKVQCANVNSKYIILRIVQKLTIRLQNHLQLYSINPYMSIDYRSVE